MCVLGQLYAGDLIEQADGQNLMGMYMSDVVALISVCLCMCVCVRARMHVSARKKEKESVNERKGKKVKKGGRGSLKCV